MYTICSDYIEKSRNADCCVTAFLLILFKKGHKTVKNYIAKIFSVLMMAAVCTMLITGCQIKGNIKNETQTSFEERNTATKHNVKIAALKGPTSIGMVELMKASKENNSLHNYEFTIAGSADEFTADLLKGDIDIAALPCNLAANLYNKSNGKIKVIGINTLGVLYIVQTGNSVQSINDLKKKTIYTTGKGTTPEYTLNYLLESAGIDPQTEVNIEFKSEASEIAAMLQHGADIIAMLPQPYVTTVIMQNPNVNIALDVTKEWEKINGADNTVVTGVVVANSDYIEAHPEVISDFMKEYKKSADFVNTNIEAASQLVEEFDIFKAEVAQRAIPNCNISFINGSEMKTKISSYLKVLYQQNPASIGGKMPTEEFYYIK